MAHLAKPCTRAGLLTALVACSLTLWLLRTELGIRGFDWIAHLNPLDLGPSNKLDPTIANTTESTGFSWNTTTATTNLVWQPCYPDLAQRFECARLLVPLNHSVPHGEQASLALARIPSPLAGHPDYRGPILINPGGPGGSGVDQVLRAGASLSVIVGPQFDIVGFDPRGVARSTPSVDFYSSRIERALWDINDPDHVGSLHVVNTTADGLARDWATAKVTGRLASQQKHILRYINTDQTARDMLTIVEAHGQERLLYWGLSYGTTLGATFATLYPDRVGRVVLDGVMDIENYFGEGVTIKSLSDTDKAMDAFYTSCHAVGPKKCAFYDSSPALIRKNLENIYTSIKKRPLPTFFTNSEGNDTYGVVDYNLLRLAIFQALYGPYQFFKPLAEALADLSQGINALGNEVNLRSGEKIYKLFQRARATCSDCCTNGKSQCQPAEIGERHPVLDGLIAIACNDSDQLWDDFDQLKAHFETMTEESQWGEIWGGLRALCIGWPDLPKTHFRGPIGARTSHPILLISNTADVVTPLWAAKRTSTWFPKSVVLTQEASGHCSIAGPSLCTQMHVRKYFVDGVLPKPGTVCSVLGSPFDDKQALLPAFAEKMQSYHPQASLQGDEEFMNALWDLSRLGSTRGFPF